MAALTVVCTIVICLEVPRPPAEVVKIEQRAVSAPPRSGQTLSLTDDILAGSTLDGLENILRTSSGRQYAGLSEMILDGSAVLLNEGQQVKVLGFTKLCDVESSEFGSGGELALEKIIRTMKLSLVGSCVSVARVRVVTGDHTGELFFVARETPTVADDL